VKCLCPVDDDEPRIGGFQFGKQFLKGQLDAQISDVAQEKAIALLLAVGLAQSAHDVNIVGSIGHNYVPERDHAQLPVLFGGNLTKGIKIGRPGQVRHQDPPTAGEEALGSKANQGGRLSEEMRGQTNWLPDEAPQGLSQSGHARPAQEIGDSTSEPRG
jgi:protein-disulfide isomerase-like protein with CxxC motif